jgi:hypothetical protein
MSVEHRKGITCTLKEVDVVGLSGLKDPLSVAWELLPYSFVADWFIPIGDFLQARGLSQALTGSFVSSTKEVAYGYNLHVTEPDPQPWWVKTQTKTISELGYFERAIGITLEVPLPTAKPLMDVPSWKRAANAVALLSQLRK